MGFFQNTLYRALPTSFFSKLVIDIPLLTTGCKKPPRRQKSLSFPACAECIQHPFTGLSESPAFRSKCEWVSKKAEILYPWLTWKQFFTFSTDNAFNTHFHSKVIIFNSIHRICNVLVYFATRPQCLPFPLSPMGRKMKSFQYLPEQSALDYLIINTKRDGTLTCLWEDAIFLCTCLLVLTSSEIYRVKNNKHVYWVGVRWSDRTPKEMRPGTITPLNQEPGHSEICVFLHAAQLQHNWILAEDIPGAQERVSGSSQNWIICW